MINAEQKKVGPSLAAAANIRMKYFENTPTILTLKEIRTEILNDYEDLPALEVAMLLMLTEGWFNQMQSKKEIPLLEVV